MAENWYYVKSGQRCGPVPREELGRLLAMGEVARDALVWTQGMASWTPAGQVEGLMPGGAPAPAAGGLPPAQAAAPASPAAQPQRGLPPPRRATPEVQEPLAAAAPVRAASPAAAEEPPLDEEFEEESAGMSTGAKIAIMGGTAGVSLLLVVAIVLIVVMSNKKPASTEGDADKTAATPTGDSKAGKKEKEKEKPPADSVLVVDLDPSALSPEERKHYDEGVQQGHSMAKRFLKEHPQPSPKEVKSELRDRDVSITVALKSGRPKDPDALKAFGWKAGLKEEFKSNNIALE